MSRIHEDHSTSGSSTAEAPRPDETPGNGRDRSKINSQPVYSARYEARELLDEIAGIAPEKRRHKSDATALRTLRNILLFPFILILNLLKLIIRPFTKAEFKLFHEMRKFLAHPGNFFWFNRLAPQAASQHFGTTSTDAMTNHARRYAAHFAVVGLALVVVIGGGFSGVVRQLVSPDSNVASSGQLSSGGYLTVTGNMKGLVLNSLGTTDNGPKRVKTYTVQAGDSLRDLATKNNINIDTILYANQIDDPDYELKIGEKIVIPPVNGMWVVASRNASQVDTIASLAARFGVEPKVIIDYAPNQLTGVDINTPLRPGDDVMVPGGVKPMRETILPYKVREGDTLDYIAQKFGVSVDTISIFNGPDEAPLKTVTAGQEIMILPVSGIRVRVQPNDTVTSIARRFNAPVENITGLPMNNVSKDTKLTVGDYLIVPEGTVPIFVAPKATSSGSSGSTSRGTVTETGRYVYVPPPPKASVTSSKAGSSAVGAISAPPAGAPKGTTGSMIWPMRGVITTYYGQAIWYGIHQGLDISTAANTPIVAADGGVVIQASWSNDGYGNMVMIAHSNGLYTLYGHLNQINVRAGQQVARGQVIGLEGSTGNSTGPHLHFEVRWGRIYGQTLNPLTYLR